MLNKFNINLINTINMATCELLKCTYWDGKKCTDPIKYVNKQGENICGARYNAIPYDEYINQ